MESNPIDVGLKKKMSNYKLLLRFRRIEEKIKLLFTARAIDSKEIDLLNKRIKELELKSKRGKKHGK